MQLHFISSIILAADPCFENVIMGGGKSHTLGPMEYHMFSAGMEYLGVWDVYYCLRASFTVLYSNKKEV